MIVAENVKVRIDKYLDYGYIKYLPDNTISLKCNSFEDWINNDQFYRDIILCCDVMGSRICFELAGAEENITVVRNTILNRIVPNLTFFLNSVNKYSPMFVIEYESVKKEVYSYPIEQDVQLEDSIEVQSEEVLPVVTKKKKEVK